MNKITVTIEDIPNGEYCCGCDFIHTLGEYKYCRIFVIPLIPDSTFYKKCEECIMKCKENINV